jgi:hypothetical protein
MQWREAQTGRRAHCMSLPVDVTRSRGTCRRRHEFASENTKTVARFSAEGEKTCLRRLDGVSILTLILHETQHVDTIYFAIADNCLTTSVLSGRTTPPSQ